MLHVPPCAVMREAAWERVQGQTRALTPTQALSRDQRPRELLHEAHGKKNPQPV